MSAMAAFLVDLGLIVTSGLGFVTEAATTVVASPVLFIGLGFGIVTSLVMMIKK